MLRTGIFSNSSIFCFVVRVPFSLYNFQPWDWFIIIAVTDRHEHSIPFYSAIGYRSDCTTTFHWTKRSSIFTQNSTWSVNKGEIDDPHSLFHSQNLLVARPRGWKFTTALTLCRRVNVGTNNIIFSCRTGWVNWRTIAKHNWSVFYTLSTLCF